MKAMTTTVFIVLAGLVIACAQTKPVAETKPVDLMKAVPRQITDTQHLSCQIEGFAGAVIAENRDFGSDIETSKRAALTELNKLDTSAEIDRKATEHTKSVLDAVANRIYKSRVLNADTSLHVIRDICRFSLMIGTSNEALDAMLIKQAEQCQRDFGAESHGKSPPTKLQKCVDDVAQRVYGVVLR